jgi:hypothetical protein
MFCVSGFSGVGKDEFCRRLVKKHGATHTGLADPAKRHMADVYGFSRDQLFGPSASRNAGDPRYPKTCLTSIPSSRPALKTDLLLNPEEDYTDPRKNWWLVDINDEMLSFPIYTGLRECPNCPILGVSSMTRYFIEDTDPRFFLSPREALQLYCNLLNDLFLCTWVRHGVEVHKTLAQRDFLYDRMAGLFIYRHATKNAGDFISCFSDFRHIHEIKYVKANQSDNLKVVLVRVKRPGIEKPPFNHRSEIEQTTIPDSDFDFVVNNDASVKDLHDMVDAIVAETKLSITEE